MSQLALVFVGLFVLVRAADKLSPEAKHKKWLKDNEWPEDSKVNFLNVKNLDENIAKYEALFVFMYIQGCRRCTDYKKMWVEAAEKNEKPQNISFGAISCLHNLEICRRFEGMRRYPAFYLIRGVDDDEPEEFHGKRTTKQFLKFAGHELEIGHEHLSERDHTDPPRFKSKGVVELNDDNFNSFKNSGSIFILYLSPWCQLCKKIAKMMDEAADLTKEYSDVHVAYIDCDKQKSLCYANDVRGYPTIKIYKKGEMVKAKSLDGTGMSISTQLTDDRYRQEHDEL